MGKLRKKEEVEIIVGPPDKPYGKIIRSERRFGLKDRRRLSTYVADDRRGGLSDRRDYKRFLSTR